VAVLEALAAEALAAVERVAAGSREHRATSRLTGKRLIRA